MPTRSAVCNPKNKNGKARSVFGLEGATYPYPLRTVVIDEFYKNPDVVREWALAEDYHRPAGVTGWRTKRKFLLPETLSRLEKCWGAVLSPDGWNNDYNGTCFLGTSAGRYRTKPFIHADTPFDYITALVFLTPRRGRRYGTTLFRHKPTGLFGIPDEKTLRRMQLSASALEDIIFRDLSRPRSWEAVEQIDYRYNRAVMYPAGRFHSASKHFGRHCEDGRLWQSFHFGLKF